MNQTVRRNFGLILAGGKSRRMGQDKALLPWNGKSLIEHQFRQLENVLGEGQVFVSGVRPGFPSVADEIPGQGPIEGIHSFIAHMQINDIPWYQLLIAPLDMPHLTATLLKNLLLAEPSLDFAHYAQCELPVALTNSPKLKSALQGIRNLDSAKEHSLKNLFSQLQGLQLPNPDPLLFQNLNTPEDYRAALSAPDHTR